MIAPGHPQGTLRVGDRCDQWDRAQSMSRAWLRQAQSQIALPAGHPVGVGSQRAHLQSALWAATSRLR